MAEGRIKTYVKGLDERTVLEPKIQQLCAISALTAMGTAVQLKSHIKIAFRVGVTEAEVKEAIIQTVRYCGIPLLNIAFAAYEEVIQELD